MSPGGATRIEIRPRPGCMDGLGRRAARKLGFSAEAVTGARIYYLIDAAQDREPLADSEALELARTYLADPLTDEVRIGETRGEWAIEVGLRPGVTDNEGNVASEILREVLGRSLRVHHARQFTIRAAGSAQALEGGTLASHCRARLGNPLVERFRVPAEGDPPFALDTVAEPPGPATIVPVSLGGDAAALMRLSKERVLALSVAELRSVREYFERPAHQAERAGLGLPPDRPTDVELEAIAQTWSEHCKHKVFNDAVVFRHADRTVAIPEGLFRTFIRGATEVVSRERDFLVSVFTDNAGVVRFDEDYDLVFKVETHNSPSALEPYGGALTGIVGVNRDPAGTGLGAQLLFNTDVFCVAPPDWTYPLPEGILPPARILAGIRQGVEDGGNQSGIPTVNGAVFFDARFLARPLVFCGTGGLLARQIAGRPGHTKQILPGDLIVMLGGRVGRDGIHGATFSSEGVAEETPSGVVQIGDPITQKRALDLLAEARPLGLYRALTDNGAGGLSSSVGELAQLSGGCEIHLDQVPLKAIGLCPWEIFVSESQERMTLAVPPERWDQLAALAARRQVEATVIGHFTDSGHLTARFGGKVVARLELEWLHHTGLPARTLEAEWPGSVPDRHDSAPGPAVAPLDPAPGGPGEDPGTLAGSPDRTSALLALLGAPNICSREGLIRQYDHEVQGGSVIKPLVGIHRDGPSDAAVLRPRLDSGRAVAVSNGLGCRLAEFDPYLMAVHAVDEAIRNAVCVGADPDHLAILDNFCWPDPVHDPDRNPDGRRKMGALVRACQGLHDAAIAYAAPLISGKDSVKNDFMGKRPRGGAPLGLEPAPLGPGAAADELKLSAPPTLLVSALAVVPEATRAVSMDFKAPGDLVYVLGLTRAELATGEYESLARQAEAKVPPASGALAERRLPTVDPALARRCYRAVHAAMQQDLVASCHDASDGGLAVALAECAIAGELGVRCDLSEAPGARGLGDEAVLFSETGGRLVLSVAPADRERFEAHFPDLPLALVGRVAAVEPRSWKEGRSGVSERELPDAGNQPEVKGVGPPEGAGGQMLVEIEAQGRTVVRAAVAQLKRAWQETPQW